MQKLCATICLSLGVSATAFAQPVPPKQSWLIESPTGVEIDLKSGEAVASNVVVKYADAVLTAQHATINKETGDVVAEGSVALQYEGQIILGESLHYNFYTRKVLGRNFRAGHGPFFTRNQVFLGDGTAGVYVGADSQVTADDYKKPSYSLTAKSMVVVPGEYIEAHNATMRVGNVPVFFLPYYKRSLKEEAPRWEVTPGYRTAYGAFLLNTYHWYRSEAFDSSIHLDAREKRGFGAGPDFNWRLKEWGDGTLRGYYANDLEPGVDANGKPIDDDRYRIWFAHQASPRTNLTITAVARYQSDPTVIHDFFEGEYRRNVQPSSFVEANQLWSNYSLDVLAMPRVNSFFETVERLPDVKLTGFRQQIGNSPFYYESDSSLGYYRREFASGSTNQPFAAMRADSLQQVVLPYTFFDFLNVTPRAGGRFTHYGEAEGPGAMTTEQDRGVFNTGAEVTAKASRLWPQVESRFWEVDGLRHILQPSVNYSFVPNPTVSPQRLPQFDYEVPTTRLLPIEFPDYNAIDAIDSQNVLRLGVRNKLQTKRKGQLENVVNWALVTDYRITRHDNQEALSDLYSEFDLRPFHWLLLSSDIRFHMPDQRINEAIHQATLTPNDTWSLSLGHRYLHADPLRGILDNDNLILAGLYYRFNENWGFRTSHQYQARDGVLEEQQYSIYRDLRSWTAALTFRVRDNRIGPKDYTVAFTFSLKSFPRFHVDQDQFRPYSLLGY